MLYVDRVESRVVEMMRFLAVALIQSKQFVGYGMTIGNGSPPGPVLGGSTLSSFVFLIPPFAEDFSLKDDLFIEGESVQPLWVVPITSAERALISNHGVAAFCKQCDAHKAPYVLSPYRSCYVAQNSTTGTAKLFAS